MRARAVADGQQVDIPVLQYDRTVGTRKESGSREWKARYKRGTSHIEKAMEMIDYKNKPLRRDMGDFVRGLGVSSSA